MHYYEEGKERNIGAEQEPEGPTVPSTDQEAGNSHGRRRPTDSGRRATSPDARPPQSNRIDADGSSFFFLSLAEEGAADGWSFFSRLGPRE
jgi:hypothetical protein